MAQEIVVDYKAEIDKITRDLERFVQANEELAKNQDKVQKELDQTSKSVDKLEKEFQTAGKSTTAASANIKNFAKGAESEVKKLGSVIKTVGSSIALSLGAAFSVDAAINLARVSIDAFLDAESNAKRLRNAIINISGASERAFDRLIKQSAELQKITIFSDDSIQQAQTALATFGLTADQIEAIIPKLADFATVSGRGIEQAAELVGSGLEGIGREFNKYGIEVSATATRQENFNSILNGFSKFAGSAEDATKSFTGQIEQQKNEIGDLQEIIGQRLLPGFLKIQQFGLRAVKVISDLFAGEVQSDAQKAAEQFTKVGNEFNLLIETLQRGNLTQDQRKQLIGQINTEYKEYLPNLISEKSSLEEIASIQAEVNKQLEGRIILVALEEDITRITKNAVAATKALLEVQKDRIKAEKDLSDNAALANLTRDQLNQREALANELLRVAREELAGLQKAYADLAARLGINLSATNKIVKAQDDLRVATGEAIRELEKITDIDITPLQNIFIQSTIGVQSFRTAVRGASEDLNKLAKTEFEIDLEAKNKARIDGFVLTFKDGLDEIETETKITTDQILSETSNLVNQLQSITAQYTDFRLAEIQREKDAQIASYDEQQTNIDENLKKRRISETEAARLTEQLGQKRAADEKRLAEKERALKRKQFEIDKAAALINIAINTAVAVTENLGVPALAALVAILGAAEAAVVAAQPNPYRKGTMSAKPGLALVDEEGRETIYRHGYGRLTTLEQGDKVLPVRQSKRYAEALDSMFQNRFSEDYVKVKDITPRLLQGRTKKESAREKSFAENLRNSLTLNVSPTIGRKLEEVKLNNVDELAQAIAPYLKRDIYRY